MDERRHQPRTGLQVSVVVRVEESELLGKTIDLSSGGINVQMFRNLPPGTPCTVAIRNRQRGHPQVFEAQAKVVHATLSPDGGFRIGMMFTEIDPSSRELLSTLLLRPDPLSASWQHGAP
jgi:c-di-GMP-binding flagellar brake protein YcgR